MMQPPTTPKDLVSSADRATLHADTGASAGELPPEGPAPARRRRDSAGPGPGAGGIDCGSRGSTSTSTGSLSTTDGSAGSAAAAGSGGGGVPRRRRQRTCSEPNLTAGAGGQSMAAGGQRGGLLPVVGSVCVGKLESEHRPGPRLARGPRGGGHGGPGVAWAVPGQGAGPWGPEGAAPAGGAARTAAQVKAAFKLTTSRRSISLDQSSWPGVLARPGLGILARIRLVR